MLAATNKELFKFQNSPEQLFVWDRIDRDHEFEMLNEIIQKFTETGLEKYPEIVHITGFVQRNDNNLIQYYAVVFVTTTNTTITENILNSWETLQKIEGVQLPLKVKLLPNYSSVPLEPPHKDDPSFGVDKIFRSKFPVSLLKTPQGYVRIVGIKKASLGLPVTVCAPSHVFHGTIECSTFGFRDRQAELQMDCFSIQSMQSETFSAAFVMERFTPTGLITDAFLIGMTTDYGSQGHLIGCKIEHIKRAFDLTDNFWKPPIHEKLQSAVEAIHEYIKPQMSRSDIHYRLQVLVELHFPSSIKVAKSSGPTNHEIVFYVQDPAASSQLPNVFEGLGVALRPEILLQPLVGPSTKSSVHQALAVGCGVTVGNQFGTLGGFVIKNNRSHLLTVGHLFGNDNMEEVLCNQEAIARTPEANVPLDCRLAAMKTTRFDCRVRWSDRHKLSIVGTQKPQKGDFVFTFGAQTGKITYGVIEKTDFQHHTELLEPGSILIKGFKGPFAQQGDSGALVFQFDVDVLERKSKQVTVVALVTHSLESQPNYAVALDIAEVQQSLGFDRFQTPDDQTILTTDNFVEITAPLQTEHKRDRNEDEFKLLTRTVRNNKPEWLKQNPDLVDVTCIKPERKMVHYPVPDIILTFFTAKQGVFEYDPPQLYLEPEITTSLKTGIAIQSTPQFKPNYDKCPAVSLAVLRSGELYSLSLAKTTNDNLVSPPKNTVGVDFKLVPATEPVPPPFTKTDGFIRVIGKKKATLGMPVTICGKQFYDGVITCTSFPYMIGDTIHKDCLYIQTSHQVHLPGALIIEKVVPTVGKVCDARVIGVVNSAKPASGGQIGCKMRNLKSVFNLDTKFWQQPKSSNKQVSRKLAARAHMKPDEVSFILDSFSLLYKQPIGFQQNNITLYVDNLADVKTFPDSSNGLKISVEEKPASQILMQFQGRLHVIQNFKVASELRAYLEHELPKRNINIASFAFTLSLGQSHFTVKQEEEKFIRVADLLVNKVVHISTVPKTAVVSLEKNEALNQVIQRWSSELKRRFGDNIVSIVAAQRVSPEIVCYVNDLSKCSGRPSWLEQYHCTFLQNELTTGLANTPFGLASDPPPLKPFFPEGKQVENLQQAIQQNSTRLFAIHSNVRMVHQGSKMLQSGETEPCVLFAVKTKGFIPLGEKTLPALVWANGVFMTTVVEEVSFKTCVNTQLYKLQESLFPGVGIGVKGSKGWGTLGGFLISDHEDVYLVTNAHVVKDAYSGTNQLQTSIEQPCEKYQTESSNFEIGTLIPKCTIRTNWDTKTNETVGLDAALIKLKPESRPVKQNFQGLCFSADEYKSITTPSFSKGLSIKDRGRLLDFHHRATKTGAATETRDGYINTNYAELNTFEKTDVPSIASPGFRASNQIVVMTEDEQVVFGSEGDSGSFIVHAQSGLVVALLHATGIASNRNFAVGSPIWAVVEFFETIVGPLALYNAPSRIKIAGQPEHSEEPKEKEPSAYDGFSFDQFDSEDSLAEETSKTNEDEDSDEDSEAASQEGSDTSQQHPTSTS